MLPYGYDTQEGYMGRLPGGAWMLFATQSEYREYLLEISALLKPFDSEAD